MNFKIEFEEQIWGQIIDMLADQPYKRSGAIINTMAMQMQEQRQKDPESIKATANGSDRSASIGAH